jgi:hypothetical protein
MKYCFIATLIGAVIYDLKDGLTLTYHGLNSRLTLSHFFTVSESAFMERDVLHNRTTVWK